MKMHRNKAKLFIEHLEKRVSTSPLFVQIRSMEELGMMGYLKKLVGPRPHDPAMEQIAESKLIGTHGKNLSARRFVHRLEQKQKHLANMAFDKEKLPGKNAAGATSGNKFVNRIEQKHKQLASMAFDKEKLIGRHVKETASGSKFVNRIEHKHRQLASMAFDKEKLLGKISGQHGGWREKVKRLLKRHSDNYDPYAQA